MTAIGTFRKSSSKPNMSAFGNKADMTVFKLVSRRHQHVIATRRRPIDFDSGIKDQFAKCTMTADGGWDGSPKAGIPSFDSLLGTLFWSSS